MYFLLKSLHVAFAIASISGFALRWWWMRTGSHFWRHPVTRIAPHVIDTLFLATGIWLTLLIHQYPFVQAWLTAKVLGLVAYVVLGTFALKRARTPAGRTVAFILALVLFAWIISVARLKTPLGFIALLA